MKSTLKSALFLSFMLVSKLHAADAQQPNAMGSFIPLIVIFVIFYFFLIRPQQKKAKDHQKMLNELKNGMSHLELQIKKDGRTVNNVYDIH